MFLMKLKAFSHPNEGIRWLLNSRCGRVTQETDEAAKMALCWTMIASTERPKSNPGTKAVIFIKGHNGILSAQTASTFLRFD